MKKIITLVLLSFLAIACSEQDVILEEEQGKGKEVFETKFGETQNMLQFETANDLNAYIEEYATSDLLSVAKEQSHREDNYTPLLLVYNLTGEEAEALGVKEEDVASVNTNDDMLLFLLNENGEIGIENKIYRIDGDFVYTYVGGNDDEIEKFDTAYELGKIKIADGDTLEFSKTLSVFKHTNNKVVQEHVQGKRQAQTSYHYFSSDYRMRAKQFNGFWGFYSSIGANTKVEQKKKFLWWSDWRTVTAYNRLAYNATYRIDYTSGFPSITLNAVGGVYPYSNQAQKIYAWSVGVPIAPEVYVPLEGYTKHWAHWYTTPVNTVSTTLYY